MNDKILQASIHIKKMDFKLDVNLKISLKGVTAIYGPSGSGKTTLLRAIAGLEKKTNNITIIMDDIIWEASKIKLSPLQRNIGFVTQTPNLFPHLNVKDNVFYGLHNRKQTTKNNFIDLIINSLQISDILDKYPSQLSGGQAQKVSIARALVYQPSLLLLDEPLNNIDYESKHVFVELIRTIQNKLQIPIIYIDHNPAEVEQLADYLIILNQGRIEAHGSLKENKHWLKQINRREQI